MLFRSHQLSYPRKQIPRHFALLLDPDDDESASGDAVLERFLESIQRTVWWCGMIVGIRKLLANVTSSKSAVRRTIARKRAGNSIPPSLTLGGSVRGTGNDPYIPISLSEVMRDFSYLTADPDLTPHPPQVIFNGAMWSA